MADINQQGQFITDAIAKANVQAYLADTGTPQLSPSDPNHVIGYIFGVDMLKKLIADMDTYNKTQTDPTKKLQAVRFYNSKSVRPGQEALGPVRDLVAVAVTADGVDYPAPIVNTSTMAAKGATPQGGVPPFPLGDTRPCPNQCG